MADLFIRAWRLIFIYLNAVKLELGEKGSKRLRAKGDERTR
jgi:hypothetical protein